MISLRALRETDDVKAFRSGNEDLDRFFHRYAARNQFVEHIGATYVALDGDAIAGFVTVAPASIKADEFPTVRARKLPRYPLPVLRLGRMAVDRSRRGKGIGTQLLRYVFLLALQMADTYGCAGVVVDAKPEAVAFYARFDFEAQDPIEGQAVDRPAPIPLFLHIETIRKAIGG